MRIWLDADGCPRGVTEHVLRSAVRRNIPVVQIANRSIPPHASALITAVRVAAGFDAADAHIAERVEAGDLVVTGDVPLAARVVAKGAVGLSPRGDVFTEENVGAKLAMRNLFQDLRAAGAVQGGPPSPGRADRQRFADALDRILTRLEQRRTPGA
ncbi:MAG TPA: YaiI/YqxD family protein [Candidatus Baltobacteraceae bacterium]|nr:YaiI/YqxD family protein [Candidatus Baltobacteraceae bacterium]